MTKQRMRRGEKTPHPDAEVLRGGALDPQKLRQDATTNFELYGFYGISVWVPTQERTADVLLATKLLKSQVVLRFTARELIAQHLELWDTGQSPHYDVVYVRADDPEPLINAVLTTPNTIMINPHYDPDGGPDR
jgi:hypothetical protein